MCRRPSTRRRTRPARSSTCTCLAAAASDMSSGAASWPTVSGPADSRSTRARPGWRGRGRAGRRVKHLVHRGLILNHMVDNRAVEQKRSTTWLRIRAGPGLRDRDQVGLGWTGLVRRSWRGVGQAAGLGHAVHGAGAQLAVGLEFRTVVELLDGGLAGVTGMGFGVGLDVPGHAPPPAELADPQ